MQVDGGTYRVNRTIVELSKAERIGVEVAGGAGVFQPESLRSVPLFSQLPDPIITRMVGRFKTEEVSLGNKLIVEGEDRSKFFIIAQGQVEVLSKGVHGSDLRIALLTEGEFFGETDLVSDKPSDVTVRTTTPCILLTLSRKDLDDFGEVTIGTATYLLLMKHTLITGQRNTDYRDEFVYRNYRKFDADSSITFFGADSSITYKK